MEGVRSLPATAQQLSPRSKYEYFLYEGENSHAHPADIVGVREPPRLQFTYYPLLFS